MQGLMLCVTELGVGRMFQSYRNRFSSVAVCATAVILSGCFDLGGSGPAPATANAPNQSLPSSSVTNSAPAISGVPTTTLQVDRTWTFTPSVSDADGDMLTFEIQNRPDWATFDVASGTLSGIPRSGDEGTYPNIELAVTDGQAISALPRFMLTVQSPNPSSNIRPRISGTPPASVLVGTAYNFEPTASDVDGDSLIFFITNRPSWATFSTVSGRLSGTPAMSDAGVYPNVVISVSDGQTSVSLPPASIEVMATAPANRAPTISGNAPGSVTAGEQYVFQPTASDPDGDSLEFRIANRPAWATFNNATGMLSGVPGLGDAGTYSNIRISVSDGVLGASLTGISITVNEDQSNDPPQISGNPPGTVIEGEQYLFVPAATDPDGDTLTFSISNRPGWAAFNTTTGRLRGTPGQRDVGIHGDIRISVSDGEFSDSLPAFAITVEELSNDPPQISGTPPTSATVGQVYSFQPSATDRDGDTLTFAISGQPSWTSFNTSTGRLNGTPQTSHAGNYDNIVISVTDGEDSAALGAFSVAVTEATTGSVTLSWAPPTTNTDGSQLDDIAAYKFYYGLSPDNLDNEVRVDSPGVSRYVIDNLAPNTYYFVSTVINESEVESEPSNIASTTVTAN